MEHRTAPRVPHRWMRGRLLTALAIASLLATGVVSAQSDGAAWAKDYPSWGDVLAARNNEAAKKIEIARLQGLLKQLEDESAAADALAAQKGDEWQKAVARYDDQNLKTQRYQEQADAAQLVADTSLKRAGQVAARLSRTGGSDLTATLFFDGDNATDLLSQLGMASKIADQSQGLYEKAKQDQNTAQSLTDQANVARDALEELAAKAELALKEAQAAAQAAADALAEKQKYNATLKAQLATLETNRRHTEAEYTAGVKAAWGANSGTVEISAQGWARPAAGRVTSGYGSRVPPTSGVSPFHYGTDIGASCNSPIHAASNGEVIYAGRYGTYGNFILIDHGSGIRTGYAHIVDGGLLVHMGQAVGVGQTIARVGSTGASTGCHLHFEVRVNNNPINAVPFMAARGITLS